MGHHSSQQRETVYSFHPYIMNLVLDLTRQGLPCFAIFSTLLREDLIVVGRDFVILCGLKKKNNKNNNNKENQNEKGVF